VPCLAIVTFGILRAPYGDPRVQGFVDRLDAVFAAADATGGLIARHRHGEAGGDFGAWATPRFVTPELAGREAQTLSLWRDLESAAAFAYGRLHAEALRRRRGWFLPAAWPNHAAWWVAGDDRPDWREAMRRLEHLHDRGPSAVAFEFRSPFDATGKPTRIERSWIAAAHDGAPLPQGSPAGEERAPRGASRMGADDRQR
jgi:hypothetical protein